MDNTTETTTEIVTHEGKEYVLDTTITKVYSEKPDEITKLLSEVSELENSWEVAMDQKTSIETLKAEKLARLDEIGYEG